MTSQRIDPQLKSALETDPDATRDLLIRVERADDETQRALEELGLDIRRRLQLVPTFAVSGRGGSVLRLLDRPWVKQIEDDQPVHTM